jgi:hypothetical protein
MNRHHFFVFEKLLSRTAGLSPERWFATRDSLRGRGPGKLNAILHGIAGEPASAGEGPQEGESNRSDPEGEEYGP